VTAVLTTLRRLKRVQAPVYSAFPSVQRLVRTIARALISSRLPIAWRQRLYNFVAVASSPVELEAAIPVPGCTPVRAQLAMSDEISSRLYFFGYSGGYEPETTEFFVRLLDTKRYVFDIGANIGYYSLLAAARLEGSGEVHAFEPAPAPFEQLRASARLNGFRSLVCNQLAVADFDGETTLFLPSNQAWTLSSIDPGFSLNDGATQIAVACKTLQTYCRERDITRVDLIKMDAEGAEIKVLHGMGPLFDQLKPDVLCEVLPEYEAELNRLFLSRGYRPFLITNEGLKATDHLSGDHRFRDYYLSASPAAM
jgi:FkbM family methyltransferase